MPQHFRWPPHQLGRESPPCWPRSLVLSLLPCNPLLAALPVALCPPPTALRVSACRTFLFLNLLTLSVFSSIPQQGVWLFNYALIILFIRMLWEDACPFVSSEPPA